MAAYQFLDVQRQSNPTDPALAAAEHFMFAKAYTAENGLSAYIGFQMAIPGYDLAKEIAFMTGTEKVFFGNPSRPGELAQYWSYRGANEGLNEFHRDMTPLISRPRREIFR